MKDRPCPECGSLLLRRPKSLRCWGCGAELDLDFNVTKPGDVEAETAARAGQGRRRRRRAPPRRRSPPPRTKKPRLPRRSPRQEEARREEAAGGTRRAPRRARSVARGAGGGLEARVDRSPMRSRRSAEPVGDPQRPPDPPGVLPAARGHVHLLARGLGGVRRGDVPGGHASGGATAGFAISGVMIARMLPAVLFGPIAGALIDRVDRKQIMIIADLGRGAMYAVDGVHGQLWAIFLLSFAIECLSLLWTPARDASLPNMVPEAAARERELDRPREHVRDAAAGRRGVRPAGGDQPELERGCPSWVRTRRRSRCCSTRAPSGSRRSW